VTEARLHRVTVYRTGARNGSVPVAAYFNGLLGLAVGARAYLPNVLDFPVSQRELIHEVHVIWQSGFADPPTLATDQDNAMALRDELEHFGLLLCERPEVVLDSGAKFLSALGTPNEGKPDKGDEAL
jgi:hypothetical protein